MSQTGERRSDRTRAGILTAARERFAADGYERATIRAIAADAAIDPAMVMRYFGSKEKLFAAAAEFDLRLPDLSRLPREEIGAALTNHFLDRWEEDDSLQALLRASVTNAVAAERMRELFADQLAPLIASLHQPAPSAPTTAAPTGTAQGFPSDAAQAGRQTTAQDGEPLASASMPGRQPVSASMPGGQLARASMPSEVATRAGLVATQALGFALCRYVLALPPVAALTRPEAVAWLGPTITRYLTGTASD
ncbi:TetR family transcriptional regulator [Kribbella sp. NPDC023855]|uniref:TetR/AcrR family transcriptional regulator n=1 Tax=Kribbella sp. NPDC023855 TaxID=3154698 RepID=UPI0033CF8DDF